ncbi:YopJ/AvrA family T3SS effector serine/threonine acetyltransferase [Bartonella sp. CB169]|uniref:YopJ/AvrA family T3SS effector serine/threonine acetyltransferase n=1 Tax=Bartonella sp. CB169 TaxID=3112257 RepID=UPI00300DD66F
MPNQKGATNQPSALKEGDKAEETLESLLARLEGLSVEGERSPSALFSEKSVRNLVSSLESDMLSGNFLTTNYSSTDLTMMSAFVKKANERYEYMNLKFFQDPGDFAALIKEGIEKGVQFSRSIICLQNPEIHFAVIDHRAIGSQTSLILFESTKFSNPNAAELFAVQKSALEAIALPDCHFVGAEMDIQGFSSASGVASLALAKKLCKQSEKILKMHRDNVKGLLCDKGAFVPCDQVDGYLPIDFYKHVYSEKRLAEYVEKNPESAHQIVNKKGENVFNRAERNLALVEGKPVSISLHKKRINESKSLMR